MPLPASRTNPTESKGRRIPNPETRTQSQAQRTPTKPSTTKPTARNLTVQPAVGWQTDAGRIGDSESNSPGSQHFPREARQFRATGESSHRAVPTLLPAVPPRRARSRTQVGPPSPSKASSLPRGTREPRPRSPPIARSRARRQMTALANPMGSPNPIESQPVSINRRQSKSPRRGTRLAIPRPPSLGTDRPPSTTNNPTPPNTANTHRNPVSPTSPSPDNQISPNLVSRVRSNRDSQSVRVRGPAMSWRR